jgi:hypothetical protein
MYPYSVIRIVNGLELGTYIPFENMYLLERRYLTIVLKPLAELMLGELN